MAVVYPAIPCVESARLAFLTAGGLANYREACGEYVESR